MFRSDLEERISHRELVEWMIYDEYIFEMQKKEEKGMKEDETVIKEKMSVEEAKAEARLDSANLADKLRDAERKAGIY